MLITLIGWGAVYNKKCTGGRWTPDESLFHINDLELKAIYFSLLSFCSDTCNQHIRLHSENITAETYIKNI